MVSPSKMPSVSLPLLGQAENLGQRPGRRVALEPCDRARARTSMPCAASPPSTFCQEKVTTSSLSHGRSMREGGRGRVADRQALAVGRDPVAVRHAHARGGAVPGEDHVVVEIDRGEIGQLAIAARDLARVLQLQLLDHVGDPALAEAFPGQHVDAAGAQQRPHRHLDGAGVGRRHDADAVIGGNAAAFRACGRWPLRAWPCRAWSGASGRAGAPSALERPAGALGAGTRGEIGIGGPGVGFMKLFLPE